MIPLSDSPPETADLAAITAQFPGREWAQALTAGIRRSELDRRRAGRLLHDQVGQLLSAAGLHLDLLRLDFRDRNPEIAERTAEIQALLEQAMAYVRDVSGLLTPLGVERSGLRCALDRLAHEAQSLFTGGVAVHFPRELQVPPHAAAALFPVAEWGLNHACATGATALRMRVSSSEAQSLGGATPNEGEIRRNSSKEGAYVLEVLYDISSPFTIEELNAGDRLNLIILRRHALSCGLAVTLESAPGGTQIRAVYGTNNSENLHAIRGVAS